MLKLLNLIIENAEEWSQGFERPFKFDPNSTVNEGRFRLFPPEDIKKDTYFRTKNHPQTKEHVDGISYVMGRRSDNNKLTIQAIRFNKNMWSEYQAGQWFNENKSKFKFNSEHIHEGLSLPKKKYQPKYFDWDTHEEFPYEEINEHPRWYRSEYDDKKNVIFRQYSDGSWSKREYDNNGYDTYFEHSGGGWIKREYDIYGNVLYYEDSYGYWEKFEFDKYGKKIYEENSNGYIEDNRDQIQEGLMLPYKSKEQIAIDHIHDIVHTVKDPDPYDVSFVGFYDKNGNLVIDYINGRYSISAEKIYDPIQNYTKTDSYETTMPYIENALQKLFSYDIINNTINNVSRLETFWYRNHM